MNSDFFYDFMLWVLVMLVVTGTWLVFFHSVGNVIIPTHAFIFFRGVEPPARSTLGSGVMSPFFLCRIRLFWRWEWLEVQHFLHDTCRNAFGTASRGVDWKQRKSPWGDGSPGVPTAEVAKVSGWHYVLAARAGMLEDSGLVLSVLPHVGRPLPIGITPLLCNMLLPLCK